MATKTPKQPKAGANGTPPALGEVLTLPEAAAFLRVSEDVISAEAETGRLPGRKIGNDWRFLKEAIVDWLRRPQPVVALPLLKDFSIPDETPEEREAFLESIRAYRDEIDRATGSGKYAPK